ncbi:NAD(P)/FAD-dependent oxidoreductase [Luteipulveratus mongoliensis]|uniref:NAD(P)/FAD-dependent oxidoreductase n=1 Tax=Luteipulveratus mongoliensis TaxID=571913 RepID=UPI0009F857D2|nr:FAD-dependent oxidoreductase [Luteipulveratus mongoliensis]
MSAGTVAVIGAGVVGAACARALALRGLSVHVIERGMPGAGTTSHGEGNILVSDKAPGPELTLAMRSRQLWPQVLEELAEQLGHDAVRHVEWEPKGGVVVATTEQGADALQAFATRQQQAGVRAEPLSADELAEAEPHVTREARCAYLYPDDAQVQPVGAATLLLRSAVMAGAQLHCDTTVLGGITSGDSLRALRTTAGTMRVDAVVNAAGPWAGAVASDFGVSLDIRPRRGEVLVTTAQPPIVHHKVYDADYVGAVDNGSAAMQTSTVVESTRSGTILIGSTRRLVGFNSTMGAEQYAALAAGAITLFPRLAVVPVMRAYGGFRPFTPDHLPVIGPDPRLAGLWHATGHEGAGIGLSVGTAQLLAQLMVDGVQEPDLSALGVRQAVTNDAVRLHADEAV